VEMFPKIVNLLGTKDDVEDAVPPGIRLAKRRLSAFFAARLAKLGQFRAAVGATQASGELSSRYGEAGGCSEAKSQRLTTLDVSGEPDLGLASYSCRPRDTWLTSHLQPSDAPYDPAFRIVYIARGVAPCQPGRTRCVLNSGEIVDILDAVALLLSSQLPHKDLSTTGMAAGRRGRGCVHVNYEVRTHTFLESVDVLRSADMIVSVQGSQNFNLLFASNSAIFVEMVPFVPFAQIALEREKTGETKPTEKFVRAESNRIFLGSVVGTTAILPIPGFHIHSPTPFKIDPCRIVRLIAQIGPLPHVRGAVVLYSCCSIC
jgi:hypothetical protein